MTSPSRNKVHAVLATALFMNACAIRAAQPTTELVSTEPGPRVAGMSLLGVTVEPLSVHVPVEPTPPEQALAATQGGIAFDELISVAPEAPVPARRLVSVLLRNVNSHEEFELVVGRDGVVPEEQVDAVASFFSCRRTGRSRPINQGVLRVIAALAEEYPGKVIEVISGYRAPPYGVKDSKHFDGRAIDLRVRGVKLSKVRDFVWKHFSDVGVGYYQQQRFVHIDYRPEQKDTAWSSSAEAAVYEYNPRWAMRIRPPWREPHRLIDEHEHELEHAHPSEAQLAHTDVALTSANEASASL